MIPNTFMKKVSTLAVCLSALLSPWAIAEYSVFTPENNSLTLPAISVDQQLLKGVNVSIPPGQPWRLMGAGTLASPLTSAIDAAVYDSRSAMLLLPRTQIGNYLYANIVLSVPPLQPWSVVSMGGMLSATSNTFAGVSFPVRSVISNRYATDSGGELTYQLNNGQVWKIVQDEPCMPVAAASDPQGTSEVEIYVNPAASNTGLNAGNFRFVSFYPDKREAVAVESCIVVPVSGVGEYSGGPGPNSVQVTPTKLTGGVGGRKSLFISGGSEPYTIVTDTPGIVSFYPQPTTLYSSGQLVDVTLDRIGEATLTVLDFNRNQLVVAVEVGAASSSLSANPSSIESAVGFTWQMRLEGGVPPYSVYHNPSPESVQINLKQQGELGVPAIFEVVPVKSPGDTEFTVEFVDAAGQRVGVKMKITGTTDKPRDPILK